MVSESATGERSEHVKVEFKLHAYQTDSETLRCRGLETEPVDWGKTASQVGSALEQWLQPTYNDWSTALRGLG